MANIRKTKSTFPFAYDLQHDMSSWSQRLFRDGSGNTNYIGYCLPEYDALNDSDQAVWAIQKIGYTGTDADSIAWVRDSDGDIATDQILDDRAGLTYK